jgi:3-dehydroquinate synthase
LDRVVHIPLGDRAYDVLFVFEALSELGQTLRERGVAHDNAAVITSPTVGTLYYGEVDEGLRAAGFEHVGRWDLPDGEENKSLEGFCGAVRWLARFTPNPAIRPVVVALGGGVVGDLAGFAAATFRRGVPYVQVPTSLLAAVDSSVGGKTAVNLPEGKNLVGAFHQPKLVYMDLATLRTLEPREVRSGAAEIIKHGAILDADLFGVLEQSIDQVIGLDREALLHVVPRNVELKGQVVSEDERERKRIRVCLNFGHTLGHAIEKASEGRLTHGEAVAVGMVAAGSISLRLGVCGDDVPRRLNALIARAGLPVRAEAVPLDHVLELMQHDKKFTTGRNLFILLRELGQWMPYEGVPMDLVREAAARVLG